MRDILNDLEAGRLLSDPDPVRRAQIQMRTPLPKRFYKEVAVAPSDGGFVVHLDGKPVKTPGKALLLLPTERAAQLVADEFAAQGETHRPGHHAGLSGSSTRRSTAWPTTRRRCWRTSCASPPPTCSATARTRRTASCARQNEAWDPVLDWAQDDARRALQPRRGRHPCRAAARERSRALGLHLGQRAEPLRLAALHVMTTLTGSALLALAVDAGELDAEAAWIAAHVDEDWQAEHWGQDAEAMARRANRKRDMLAAANLLQAIRE